MKKNFFKVICMALMFSVLFQSIAMAAEYYPDYSGEGTKFGTYLGGYNNDTEMFTFGSIYGDQYYNIHFEPINLDNYEVEDLYFKNERYQVIWNEVNKDDPIPRKMAFISMYDFILSSDFHTSFPEGDAYRFSDFEGNEDYKKMIADLNGMGLLDGNEKNGKFYLDFDETLTRAQFAKLLEKMNVMIKISEKREDPNFKDISGHWAEESIKLAYRLEFINGYNEDQFGPDDEVTYKQLLIMMFNSARGLFYTSDSFLKMLMPSPYLWLKEFDVIF